MCIILDTASKMSVDTLLMFQIWEACQKDCPAGEGDTQYCEWRTTGKISDSVESWCLDILSGRTLLVETSDKPLIRLRRPKGKRNE